MKALLTSAGIGNPSLRTALITLLGKPIEEARALFVPTAIYGIPHGGDIVRRVICGTLGDPFCGLPWKSLGLLELTALPSIVPALWLQALEEADALLVGGGDCQYLSYWMHASGVAARLPVLLDRLVYVGLSAGSMILTRYGTTYGHHILPPDTPKCIGLLDCAIHPHLDYPAFPDNAMAKLEALAATLPVPSYLIDDQTGLLVQDGAIQVVSEGNWKLVQPSSAVKTGYC